MPTPRVAPKAPRKRKAYPKRASVRSTVMQRAKTLEYAADPVPGFIPMSKATQEQKYLDMAVAANECEPSPLPADIELLNQIGQGTSVNTRIGMRYQMTGVHLRGQIYSSTTQLKIPQIAGFYIVYDSEPHGSLATAQEMFNLRYNDMRYAFPNGSEGQKGGRFKYICRKEYVLGNNNSDSQANCMDGVHSGYRLINEYIPLNKLPVQCMRMNTGSSITTIQKGALLLVPFGHPGAAVSGTANNPILSVAWRLYFSE